jgi:hypothetical protein
MKSAFGIFDMVASLMTVKRANSALEDPTLYQIKTNQHEYAGKILFQDNMIIKLKVDEMKVVKILKENIRKITIQKEASMNFQMNTSNKWASM